MKEMLKAYFLKKNRGIGKLLLLFFAVFVCTILTSQVFAQPPSNRQQNSNVALPLVVANRFEIKPEQRELFLKLATAALAPTRSEPGCISYGFYEQPTAKNSFLYYEEWKDRAALSNHLKQPYVQPLLAKFPEILNGSLIVRVYTTNSVARELPQ
jgi:quinol monooxygenase YgiN